MRPLHSIDAVTMAYLGDIMYIKSVGKGILVLNSHSAAVDLLDRRGGNYSDRQTFIGKFRIPSMMHCLFIACF